MTADDVLSKLSEKEIYHREDLFRLFCAEKGAVNDAGFRWSLYNFLREGKLFHVDYDSYSILRPSFSEYHPVYSEKSLAIMKMLENKCSDLQFVVFESVLLNEFLNHLIAQNTIFVQVEKELSSTVFSILQNEFPGTVLYNPTRQEFAKYWTKECVVVLDLISQSPISSETPHEITAEKMLVDIVAEKTIASVFSLSEIPSIFESMLGKYRIDRRKINRYAGRRGKAEIIKQYLGEKDAC